MIGAIDSAFLQFGLYDTWNMKIHLDEEDCAMLKDKLIMLIDDNGTDTELVLDRCNARHYPFADNGMFDDRHDPSHDVSKFKPGRPVPIEFQLHSRDFCTPTKPKVTKD
ncbi:hypothetical protein MMC22_002716 [Lobaria immixta]|nr:hypothetical protein [Lobaria immixta]